jgi:hypothetical protein
VACRWGAFPDHRVANAIEDCVRRCCEDEQKYGAPHHATKDEQKYGAPHHATKDEPQNLGWNQHYGDFD